MTERVDFANRVAMRVPPFNPANPQLWFAQLEGHFRLTKIDDDNDRFDLVSANLDPRFAQEVEDIIINPPESRKYTRLREELSRRLCVSDHQRIKQLLSNEDIGDRKPTQYLRHLRVLADGAKRYVL
ncbi:hypothetical protein J437_LFUL013602 [Ladona fulva]|uniref:DUF7041 domain-containing protein n=1 Tax=Ladona fulva TaxID=123851 RepID=A0A8K0KER4_LADFU|nr:hypothetical protein J437_LFUL013602 [Ladona fulva]